MIKKKEREEVEVPKDKMGLKCMHMQNTIEGGKSGILHFQQLFILKLEKREIIGIT